MNRIWAETGQFASRHPSLFLALVALVSTIAALHPIVFQGRSLATPNNGALSLYPEFPTVPSRLLPGRAENPMGSDTGAFFWAFSPYAVTEHRAIFHEREAPVWYRFGGGGLPLLGQGLSLLGDPLHWPVIASGGAPWAWDVRFFVARWLFCFGIALLIYRSGGSLLWAALFGATAAWIGFFTFRFVHPAQFTLGYAPWLFLCTARLCEREQEWFREAALTALLWVAVFCSGTVKESAMLMLGSAATALITEVGRGRSVRALLRLGVAALLFVGCGAVFLVTFFETLRNAATPYAAPTAFQIRPALLLGFFDDLFYRGAMPGGLHLAPSMNLVLLPGILFALASIREWWKQPAMRAQLFVGSAALAVVFGIVPAFVLARLPFVGNISHLDNTFSCVAFIPALLLSAWGWRRLADPMVPPLRLARRIVVPIGLLTLIWWGETQTTQRTDLTHVSGGTIPNLHPALAIACFVMAALTCALPFLVQRVVRTTQLRERITLGLCLVALLWRHGCWSATPFDLVVANPMPREDFRRPSPAISEALRQQNQPDGPSRIAGLNDILAPGFQAVYGLEHTAGADPLNSRFVRELAGASAVPFIWGWRPVYTAATLGRTTPFLRMSNTNLLLTRPDEPVPSGWQALTHEADAIQLCKSRNGWPRAFFAATLHHAPDAAAVITLFHQLGGSPFAAAPGADHPSVRSDGPGNALFVGAEGYQLTTAQTAFTVNCPAAGWIVLCEAWWPGEIRASLNGKPVIPFRVNHAFIGLPVPEAGIHRVIVRYGSQSLRWAAPVTYISLAAIVVIAAFQHRISRWRRLGIAPR